MRTNLFQSRPSIHNDDGSFFHRLGVLLGLLIKATLVAAAVIIVVLGGLFLAIFAGLFLLAMFALSKTGLGKNLSRRARHYTNNKYARTQKQHCDRRDTHAAQSPVILDAKPAADGWTVYMNDNDK